MLRVCVLASGSKGNATYVETSESRILVDAGLSAKELDRRLATIGACAADLDALLVTHEHTDHCRGLGPMARKFKVPVYLHPQTRQALKGVGDLPDVQEFEVGESIAVRDLEITPFPLAHDAVAPVGYCIDSAAGKVGVATDLGVATRLVQEQLRQCRALVLESNHDEQMLRDGPYPWPLKQRVRGRHGHLSNGEAAELLQGLLWEGLEAVFLAHLSEVNNDPALAVGASRQMLQEQNGCDPELILGWQHQASDCYAC